MAWDVEEGDEPTIGAFAAGFELLGTSDLFLPSTDSFWEKQPKEQTSSEYNTMLESARVGTRPCFAKRCLLIIEFISMFEFMSGWFVFYRNLNSLHLTQSDWRSLESSC